MAIKTRNGMTFEGTPGTCSRCPIAVWLREGGFNRVLVSEDSVYASLPDDTQYWVVRADYGMAAVRDFIYWFDGTCEDDQLHPTEEV